MKEKAKKEKNYIIKTERNFPLILNLKKNQDSIEVNEILDCLEKDFGFIKNSIQLKNKDDNKILNINEIVDVKNLNNIVVSKSKYKNLSFKVNEKIIFENKKNQNKIQQKKNDNNNNNIIHKMKSDINLNNNKNIFNDNNNNNKIHHNNTNYNEINNNNYFKNYHDSNYNFEDYENFDENNDNNYFDDNDNHKKNNNNQIINKNDINKLKEMGFNKDDCIQALTECDGNFEEALNYLISKNEY